MKSLIQKFISLSILVFAVTLSLPTWAQFSVVESFNESGYTFSFFGLGSTEADQTEVNGVDNGTGRLSFYNYLTIAKRLTYDLKGGVRLPFQYNTAGRDRFNDGHVQKSELFLQDVILFLRNDALTLLPGDIGVYWEGRIYLPTSENSQKRDQIGRYRNHFIFSKILSRVFDMEYDQKISYYHQSRTAYKNTFVDNAGDYAEVTSLTKSWELEHRLNFWYKMDAETGFGLQAGHKDQYFNSSTANAYNQFDKEGTPRTKGPIHEVKFGPAARFALNSKINFILTYEDVVNANENMGELAQFKSENSQVTLLSFVRF